MRTETGPQRGEFAPSDAFSRAFAGEQENKDVVIAEKSGPGQRRKNGSDFRHAMLTQEELARFERGQRLRIEREKASSPDAVSLRRKRRAAFDARTVTLREQQKAQNPESIDRHKKVLENFDERTDDIRIERKKMWMSLVETFLALGKEGLQDELSSPAYIEKKLTKKTIESDSILQKQLSSLFVSDRKKRTLADFLDALPEKDDYEGEVVEMEADYAGKHPDHAFDFSDVSEIEAEPLDPFAELRASQEGIKTAGLQTAATLAREQNPYDEITIQKAPDNISAGSDEKAPIPRVVNKHVIPRARLSAKRPPAVPEGVLAELAAIARDWRKEEVSDVDVKPRREAKNSQESLHASGEIENLPDVHRPVEKPSQNQQNQEQASALQAKVRIEQDSLKQAVAAYVAAYRAYDKQFTQNKTDEQVAATKPPLLAGFFKSANSPGKKLKRLYQELQDAASYAQSALLAKNLVTIPKPESFLTPSLQHAAQEVNIRDEKTITSKQKRINDEVDEALDTAAPIMTLPKFLAGETKSGQTLRYLQAVKERSGMNPNFSSPLTRELKNKTVQEGIGLVQEKRIEGIKKRIQEIELYFAGKNPEAKNKTVRQYLLGNEIKGWFKGEQKRLQQEYKDLYNNPVYQKYLTK